MSAAAAEKTRLAKRNISRCPRLIRRLCRLKHPQITLITETIPRTAVRGWFKSFLLATQFSPPARFARRRRGSAVYRKDLNDPHTTVWGISDTAYSERASLKRSVDDLRCFRARCCVTMTSHDLHPFYGRLMV